MKDLSKGFIGGAIFASLFAAFFDKTISTFAVILALLSISFAILYIADRRKE